MNRQKVRRVLCLTVAASLLCLIVSAIGEPAPLEALLDEGTTIVSIQPEQRNASYAQAVIQRDGMDAVAVFEQVEGEWALQAQSPWFSNENDEIVSLIWSSSDAFSIVLSTQDDSLFQRFTFQKTDEGWQAISYDGTNLCWQCQEDRPGIRFFNDSKSESLPVCWRVMLTDIVFSKMPQTMDEMRALLLTDDVARITLEQYATVPLREEPSEEATYPCVLIDGAVVKVLAKQTGWVRVALNDQITGWVPENLLEIGDQGYRYHYSNEMTALNGSLTIYDAPSATANVQQKLTVWPVVDIVGWCGGAFSDVSDGVWAIVFAQDEIGYVRLNTLSYGNG